MDDRQPPDSNVVQLRPNGELSKEEREQLARTIFAAQDDVSTFSCGNLVPPPPPASSAPSVEADPFFEELQRAPADADANPPTAPSADDGTDAYFARLGSQTPAEMSVASAPASPRTVMPGSARAPAEPVARRRPRWAAVRLKARAWWQPHARLQTAIPALIGLVCILAAGAGVTALAGGIDTATPRTHPQASQQSSGSPTRDVARALDSRQVARAIATHRPLPRHAKSAKARAKARKAPVALVADRRAAGAAASGASAPATQTAPPTATYSPAAQPAASPANPATSSSQSSRPAFGMNGTLGPGTSPNS